MPERSEIEDWIGGKCLVVIVQREGPYIGGRLFPLEEFEKTVRALEREYRVGQAMLFATNDSRYGDFVRVYAGLKNVYGARVGMETISIRPDIVAKPVEDLDVWSPFDMERTDLPNKALEPTEGAVMPRADARVTPAPSVAHL